MSKVLLAFADSEHSSLNIVRHLLGSVYWRSASNVEHVEAKCTGKLLLTLGWYERLAIDLSRLFVPRVFFSFSLR